MSLSIDIGKKIRILVANYYQLYGHNNEADFINFFSTV